MDDAFRVRRVEGVGNFDAQVEQQLHLERTSGDAVLQRHAIEKFHGDERMSVTLADFVDGADVGMVQRGGGAGFAAEAFERQSIADEVIGQELQSNEAAEFSVFCFVNDTHASAAELFNDAVVRNYLADQRRGVRHVAHILGCAGRQVNELRCDCRRKMRMSGLCKVEMSASMEGRGPHGNGANHFEPTRTGPIESVARGTGEASLAGSSSGAAENNRPAGAADAAADSRARGWCPGSRITRPAIESQAGGRLRTESFSSRGPALCRLRTHAGRRTLSQGWFPGEPGDPAEVDEQSGLLASALSAGEKDPRVAGAKSQFRGAGDAGQFSFPLAGGSRSSLPVDRHDR